MVLSGGGASGFAHVGVLKALEENQIPIDYITGTSAGALVGALYASGWSPKEIEAYISTPEFLLMANGQLKENQHFYLREEDRNAGIIGFSFSIDSLLSNSLPTNFVRAELLDFEMMRIFGPASVAANHNFDSLFVPFRCVASDISKKESVVLKKGYLNECVRASMTFPFYLNPICINNVLLFDGGLYNNFPADVMHQEFNPEMIIGSNVSYNMLPPTEEDLMGQVVNMVVSKSNFTLPCSEGLIISPKVNMSTFEFSLAEAAIEAGYKEGLRFIDSIRKMLPLNLTPVDLNAKRNLFKKKIYPITINEVNAWGKDDEKQGFVAKSFISGKKKQTISEFKLEQRFFHTYASDLVKYIFPTLDKSSDSSYRLNLHTTKTKPFRLDVGGVVSSRAINTGFAQLSYLRLKKIGLRVGANTYFGKFYGSAKGMIDVHLAGKLPLTISSFITINRWDYFRSFTSFFEQVKPSFLIQEESYAGLQIKFPVLNNGRIAADYRHINLRDRYYQIENFTNKDTADVTNFLGDAVGAIFEFSSLNRKQFASKGTYLKAQFRYIGGTENSISGSTSVEDYDYFKRHNWFNLLADAQHYVFHTRFFSFGIQASACLSSQPLFKNYTASILSQNAFYGFPDLGTFFLPEHRAAQFVAFGGNFIFSIQKNIDVRFDTYFFQPFKQLILMPDNTVQYSAPLKGESYVSALSAIYHSPIGPIRFTTLYLPRQSKPIVFAFTYGFILFNDKAIR